MQGQNLPLGQISESKNETSFNTKTVIGAIEHIILKVRRKWNCPILFYTGTFMENEKYQKMVNALFELKAKWNFDIIDLWNDPEMRSVSQDLYCKYMADPVQPTGLGYKQ